MNTPAKHDWINIACWTWVACFVGLKIYLLANGQSFVDWLDFTNPSLFGLLFTVCIVVLIVRSRRAGKSKRQQGMT